MGARGQRGAGKEAADEARRLWSRWGGGQGALQRAVVFTHSVPNWSKHGNGTLRGWQWAQGHCCIEDLRSVSSLSPNTGATQTGCWGPSPVPAQRARP